LYLYEYNEEGKKLHPEYRELQVGFMADEIEKVYPEIIKVIDGRKYINIEKEQLSDRRLWRIYNTINISHTLLKMIIQLTFNGDKYKKEK